MGKLWACIYTSNGDTVKVGFPLSHVAMTFDEELGKCGLVEPAQVGDYESVDGFLSRVRRAARKVATKATRTATRGFIPKPVYKRVVPKAIRRTQARLAKRAVHLAERTGYGLARRGVRTALAPARPYLRKAQRYAPLAQRYALRAARSKALGAGLAGAAVAFPAVGGPGLAAWTAANRAVNVYDRGRQAARARAAGARDPRTLSQQAAGMAQQQAIQRLSRSQDPRAQFATAALRSIPARRFF